MNASFSLIPPRWGFTFVELIVAVIIACLLLGVCVRLYSHFSHQGIQQDRQTVCWNTYGRVTEAMRDDLAQAVGVGYPGPSSIVISTLWIDDTYRCQPGTVTWSLKDDRTVVRTTGEGKSMVFSFAGGLARQEVLALKFRKAP